MRGILNAILVLLLIGLGVSLYFFYQQSTAEPIALVRFNLSQPIQQTVDMNYTHSAQFYPNLRFPSSRISYGFEPGCDENKEVNVKGALAILSDKTILQFYEDAHPQISISCSDQSPPLEKHNYFIAGEGGPTEIVNTSLFSVIQGGKILLYKDEKCTTPHIALHEMLHVLGFDHNQDPTSILYPTLDCKQKLDDYFVDDLNALYRVPSKPDLTITHVNATKEGRYLSFDIEIINQGLVSASGVSLEVRTESTSVKEFDLSTIEIGTRKTLSVSNLRIPSSAQTLKFIVDGTHRIEEIYEDNNEADLSA